MGAGPGSRLPLVPPGLFQHASRGCAGFHLAWEGMSSSVAPACTPPTPGPCEQGQDLPGAHTFSCRPCCGAVATCAFVPARGRD